MIAPRKPLSSFLRLFPSKFFPTKLSAAIAFALVAVSAARAQTTIFNDTFNSGSLSTLNGTSTPGGTASASSTSYDVASTKTGLCAITAGSPGFLREKISSGTTAGYVELQAIFTGTPVQLVNVGDSINLTVTFTNSAGTLLSGGLGSYINVGLYNSGGNKPLAGTLNGAGLSGATTFEYGACSNWQGYVCQIVSNTLNSTIFTRPVQVTGVTSGNQDLVFSGAGTGLFNGPAGTTVGSTTVSTLTLSSGSTYTESFTILLASANSVTITEKFYAGGTASGTALYSSVQTSSAANTYTNFSNQFDGLAIGLSNKGTSQDPQMDISQITVTKSVYAAPTINNLNNQTVIAGNSTVLSPTITGNPAPAYQWQTNGVNIGGATNATLALNNVQYAQNGWTYLLVATNAAGSVSNSMNLSVIVTPAISGLNNQAVLVGSTVTISPTVTGVPTPTEQWQYNGNNLTDGTDANGSVISGSATATLTITGSTVADSGNYSLIAANSAGLVTNTMNLTVSTSAQLPVVTGPTNLTVIQGSNAIFTASATGLPVPTLQWLDPTQTPISGATSGTLTLTAVQYSQNGSTYYFVASNSVGSVTNSAVLTVIVPPAISVQPVNQVVTNTQSATFSVTAAGVPSPGYQWYFNNAAISGATSSTYTIASTALSNIGSYYVVITNAAGSVTSSNVTLAVNSAMSAVAFTPANAATGLCYDTPLTVTFNSTISLGSGGTIRIYNVTNPAVPVDTIFASLGLVQQRTFPNDGQSFTYPTITINGSTAVINPHFSVMTSNQTYYVTIDSGVFVDSAGANFAGITATNVWQFATKVGGPLNPLNPVVNANGSGDFLTVQGAVNAVPSGTAKPSVISIQNGVYTEIVDVTGKTNIIFRGQSRLGTLLGFANNATYQAVNGGSTHDRMAFKVNANDIALDNLTVSNMTPQGGSQAEALMIESGAARCIVNNCDIVSRQDTILANINSSQGYFYKSAVRGNFDYIWGGGNLYFNQCVIDTIAGTSSANYTAARTTTASTVSTNNPWLNPGGTYTANGMSFVNCSITADTGAGTVSLADGNGSAGELVSWYGCDFATNYLAPSASLFSGNFIFWQCNDTMTNNPVNFAQVTTLSGNDARLLAATNIPVWLYGWVPALSPNIVTQPVGTTLGAGQSATFTATATGIPDPTYQWLDNGVPISGATGSSYTITSAARTNAGSYSVVVNNGSGTVTSSVAVLTYTNTPPVAGPVFTMGALLNIPETVQIVGGPNTPTDADGDALTITSVAGAADGTVTTDGTNVTYTATNGPSDSFTYTVSDGFGGTANQTVNVVINSNTQNYDQLSVTSQGGGINVFGFLGNPNYKYSLDMTTNLLPPITWVPQVTNQAALNGTLIFTNTGTAPQSFYRTRQTQ